jgi:hypothetical protein
VTRVVLALILALWVTPALADDSCIVKGVNKQTVTDIQKATDPDATKAVVVNTRSLFSTGPQIGTMSRVLRAVANEPGEKGWVGLDITAGGKFGTGAVNGSVEGEVDLEVSYGMSDENRVIMGFDAEAAIKAGISLAGIVDFGGKVEMGGSVIKLSFADSASAAAWLTRQLNDINRRTGYKLYPKGSTYQPPYVTPPVALTDRWGAGGVYAEGGVGDFQLAGEGKLERETRRFQGVMDGQKVDVTQITTHKIGQVQLKVPFRGGQAEVAYVYDSSLVRNSPFYFNNGPGIEHTVTIKVPLLSKSKKLSETPGEPNAATQDLLVNVFAAIEKVAPAGTLTNANYKVFSTLVNEAYENAGKTSKIGADTYLTLTLDMNYFGESDGSYSLMYQRLLIGGEQHLGGEFNIKAVKVGIDVHAGKTENVYERLGTDTISYFQRQYVYATRDRPWSKFAERNQGALEQLVRNISTKGHLYFDQRVADAYQKGGFDMALDKLQEIWRNENSQIARVREDAIKLAELTNKWQWWYGKEDLRRDMSYIFSRYPNRQQRQYMWDLIDDYGGDPAVIKELSKGNTVGGNWLRIWMRRINTRGG